MICEFEHQCVREITYAVCTKHKYTCSLQIYSICRLEISQIRLCLYCSVQINLNIWHRLCKFIMLNDHRECQPGREPFSSRHQSLQPSQINLKEIQLSIFSFTQYSMELCQDPMICVQKARQILLGAYLETYRHGRNLVTHSCSQTLTLLV